MRRLFLILFVISLVIVGIETFRPQAPFPNVFGGSAGTVTNTSTGAGQNSF
ncbi:hypothetical protein [Alicyclobacillus sp. ALC3]|uniref:hypothetical protein n=1 Tax=Alicyclobacillus sp. ALC3 TaxID=2796143 RepID=UPI002379E534|nr:hypothetical protein [Alicyclobacillus sp. ALC3]WDL98054.1 hypothetical protein JC200_04940 [Alicyclobacillus sp. ALC3]